MNVHIKVLELIHNFESKTRVAPTYVVLGVKAYYLLELEIAKFKEMAMVEFDCDHNISSIYNLVVVVSHEVNPNLVSVCANRPLVPLERNSNAAKTS